MIIASPSEDSFLKYVTNGALNMPPHHVTRWSDETLRFISDKYNLELIDIYHEKVQPIHLKWFLSTLLNSAFGSNKMINLSLFFKLKNRLFALAAKCLEKGFKREMLPNGHTVVAVYRRV